MTTPLDPRAQGGFDQIFSLPPGRALDIVLALQKAILEHRLGPGVKLSEDEVGEIYGASRTVARTALQALAHSGLATIERNRGAFVSSPTIREANEVFEARGLIEPRVARMAARAASGTDIERLRNHIETEHAALEAGDMGRALYLSGLFHIDIADIADQHVFARMVRALIARSSLVIALYWQRADTACESHSHHALIEALARGDETAADELMLSHIVDLRSGLNLRERRAEAASLKAALGP